MAWRFFQRNLSLNSILKLISVLRGCLVKHFLFSMIMISNSPTMWNSISSWSHDFLCQGTCGNWPWENVEICHMAPLVNLWKSHIPQCFKHKIPRSGAYKISPQKVYTVYAVYPCIPIARGLIGSPSLSSLGTLVGRHGESGALSLVGKGEHIKISIRLVLPCSNPI